MINKNFYRKTNDKKILHKVGKQWKVVSVALLMAIGGAAVATHANANASSTDDLNNASVDETVNFLNQSGAANAPRIAQKQPVQKQNSAKPVSQGVHYYPGSNGSAASYFDKAADESGTANKYYNTVNNYVQSLNNEYGVQVNSFANKSASASSAASNDSKLASSYSVTAKNANTTATISALASKNHTTPMLYEGMVQNQEEIYSGEVKSASTDVNATSDVASLVNSFEGTNLSVDSLNASASSAIAGSNLVSAIANDNSVYARYGGKKGNYAEDYVNDANKLSAGATTLQVVANGGTYQADYDQLTAHMNAAQEANLNTSLTSDINLATTSAKSNITSLVSAAVSNSADDVADTRLDTYANDVDQTINGNKVLGFNHFVQPDTFVYAGNQSLYNEAVSAAADTQVAPALASAANSLYGKYNPEYADASTLSTEASAAEQSADDEVRAMWYASGFASANSELVSSVSNDVSQSNGDKAATAKSYLDEGVTAFANKLGISLHYDWSHGEHGPKVNNYSNFEGQVLETNYYTENAAGQIKTTKNSKQQPTYTPDANKVTLIQALLGVSYSDNGTTKDIVPTNDQNDQNKIANDLRAAANALNGVNFVNDSDQLGSTINKNKPSDTTVKGEDTLNGTSISNLVSDSKLVNGSSALSSLGQALLSDTIVGDALNDAANNGINVKETSLSNSNTTMNDLNAAVGIIQHTLNEAADKATTGTNGNASKNGHNTQPDNVANDYQYNMNKPVYLNNGLLGFRDRYAFPTTEGVEFEKAALLSDGVDLDSLASESGAIANVKAAVNANETAAPTNEDNAEKLNNGLSAAADSAGSALGTAQNASANYASANDEDVTLSSYFASSYATAASNEANLSSTESSGLNSFYKSMAADSTFTNADDAYNTATAAEDNDYKLGAANAKAIYNRSAHFLDVLKGAALHTTPNFNTGNDKVVAKANKGDRLTVYGVNVSRNNSWRGVVRYFVLDNTTGKKGFITGQPNFTKSAYLSATSDHLDVQVKTLKPVRVYSDLAGKKAIATVPAGKVLDNADVVYGDASEDAHGFTKVETASDDFLTANTDYVAIVAPHVTTNNTQSNVSGNYVPNNQLNFDKYFNNDTED